MCGVFTSTCASIRACRRSSFRTRASSRIAKRHGLIRGRTEKRRRAATRSLTRTARRRAAPDRRVNDRDLGEAAPVDRDKRGPRRHGQRCASMQSPARRKSRVSADERRRAWTTGSDGCGVMWRPPRGCRRSLRDARGSLGIAARTYRSPRCLRARARANAPSLARSWARSARPGRLRRDTARRALPRPTGGWRRIESLGAVARATGLHQPLRRAFHRRVGVSPAAYRARFRFAAREDSC